uniref:Uncharacterized protein n=1 Tax=Anguilla anguilla TaxID=7936 RepID=A0A0E9SWR9_ANGAN
MGYSCTGQNKIKHLYSLSWEVKHRVKKNAVNNKTKVMQLFF